MKLALGTAQFGFHYGVANTDGQVTKSTAKHILCRAKEAGVDTLDTAITYGASEQCLGGADVTDWRVVTKLPAVPEGCVNIAAWVNEQVLGSLNRLRVKHVTGLMLHRPNQLLESKGQELWSTIQTLKEKKIVEKIGFSIYDPEELELLWDDFQPDIIQAPYNIFDQRLKKSGWLSRLNYNGIEVHVRSIFLQGLLLMEAAQRPSQFGHWQSLWDKWAEWLKDNSLSPLEGSLGTVMNEEMIDYSIVGVDSLEQLEEVLNVAKRGRFLPMPESLYAKDSNLIDPTNW